MLCLPFCNSALPELLPVPACASIRSSVTSSKTHGKINERGEANVKLESAGEISIAISVLRYLNRAHRNECQNEIVPHIDVLTSILEHDRSPCSIL